MKCSCGYELTQNPDQHAIQSFAVIDDSQYQDFLRREMKVLDLQGSANALERLKAIANSSQLVGGIRFCPVCNNLLFLHPDKSCLQVYAKVAEQCAS